MAIGSARLLGFHFPENFERPYQATSVADFWRRWHMTLSTWLRDYLFFSFGRQPRHGVAHLLNLGLTMFLVGMWHGASWNFVVYSLLQASAMVFNRFARLGFGGPFRPLLLAALAMGTLGFVVAWGPLQLGVTTASLFAVGVVVVALVIAYLPEPGTRPWWTVIHVAMTFHFVTLSRLFFRSEDLEKARVMAHQLFTFDGHGVRPGLFKMQGLWQWATDGAGAWGSPLASLANNGIFWILVLGLGYHFAPSSWVERPFTRIVRLLPGPLLGVLIAAVAWLGLSLLSARVQTSTSHFRRS